MQTRSSAELEARWHPSISEYHADPATGSTMLGHFRNNPGLYRGLYVSKTIEHEPPNRSMILGSLLHHVVSAPSDPHTAGYVADLDRLFDTSSEPTTAVDAFGYESVARSVVQDALHVVPVQKRSAVKFKDAKKEHGDIACTKPEADTVIGALAALLKAETPMAALAKWLLIDCPGEREYSHRWTHPSGEVCKIRFDCLPDQGQGLPDVEHCFVDLKFVNDPDLGAFVRNGANFGRHCQAALYSLGYVSLRPAKPQETTWPVVCYVIIGNEPPHPVKVVTSSELNIEIGLDDVHRDLQALSDCRKSGEWFDADELAEEIPDLEPTDWLINKYQRRIKI